MDMLRCPINCRIVIIYYYYASDKRCGDFSLKMCQKYLAAELPPDALGELTARPDTVAGFKGRERDRQGKEETGKAGKSA